MPGKRRQDASPSLPDDGDDVSATSSVTAVAAAPIVHVVHGPQATAVPGIGRWGVRSEALLLLLAVSVIWVGASQLVRSLSAGMHASLPWSLTYVNVAEFAVLLPLQALYERMTGRRSDWRGAARAALAICPVWYAAQGLYNASLSGTSVSSSTILSTTSCAFTLVLGLCLGDRPPWARLWKRAAGVGLVITGAVVVGSVDVGDAAATSSTRWGDALALLSAAAYAVYTTMIANLVPKGASMNVFFGFVGVFTLLTMAPWVGCLNIIGLERVRALFTVQPPFTAAPIAFVLAKGLADNVLSDLLWARAVRLSSATLGTVALALTIPLAIASDAVFEGRVPNAAGGVGAVLVAVGFVVAAWAEGAEVHDAARRTATASGAGADTPA